MRWLCVVLVVQIGCYHRPIVVEPDAIGNHSDALRSDGIATIRDSKVTLRHDALVHATVLDQPVPALRAHRTWSGAMLRVDDLLDQCPPHRFAVDAALRREYPRCPLGAIVGPVTVGRRRHSHVDPTTVVVLGAIAGLATCAYACDRPWSRIAGGTLIAGSVVLIGGVVLLLAYARSQRD
jgi:hypothetical protein